MAVPINAVVVLSYPRNLCNTYAESPKVVTGLWYSIVSTKLHTSKYVTAITLRMLFLYVCKHTEHLNMN